MRGGDPDSVWARGCRLLLWCGVLLHSGLIHDLSSRSFDGADEIDVPGLDKVVHVVIYAVWGLLFATALRRTAPLARARWIVAATVLAAVLFGALDEVHQLGVPGRTADPLDLAADGVGALLGCGFLALGGRR